MNPIDQVKGELRASMRKQRAAIPVDARLEIDHAICDHVCATDQFRSADVVFTYLSMGAEVDTREIIGEAWRAGKAVALPRCVGPRQMRWFRVSDFEGLEVSPFGVEEPPVDEETEQLVVPGVNMVALVPGFVFDRLGYRLGYGGGFYDTFLADFPGASLGLCRSAFRVDSLEALGVVGEYDVPVNRVVTDAALSA